jgi:DNA repair protein RecN (Recombination protein N)
VGFCFAQNGVNKQSYYRNKLICPLYMLQQLFIQNYAIIDELSIRFDDKLNVITGETGAGKSILMGAFSLVLGDRADTGVLRDPAKKCVVEAVCVTSNKAVEIFLQANELDAGEELVIRREIAASGKSRGFINDTPVTLLQLKQLSRLLADLHQQFDTLELAEQHFQQQVVDALADNGKDLQQYQQLFAAYQQCKKQLDALRFQQQESNKTLDYNQFLFDELQQLALAENELELLDTEIKLLSNAETVKQQLAAVVYTLKESEAPVAAQVKQLLHQLNALCTFHPAIQPLAERLQSVHIELADIADTVDDINNGIQHNPERLQLVNDRMAAGYKLLKKHSVTTTADLLKIQQQLQLQLDAVVNNAAEIAAKEAETAALLLQCEQMADVLSKRRNKIAAPFAEKVTALLARVGMPNAVLKVVITTAPMGMYGTDLMDIQFDANKSGRFAPIGKVASGGELSRIMLCIKSLVAQKLQLPVLIFDEIDTGISGEAARQVGIIMKELAHNHQVLTITHQPQIAAKAAAHYFVYKAENAGRITTAIRLLNTSERVETIAQMLAGENPTPIAINNAREMMEA